MPKVMDKKLTNPTETDQTLTTLLVPGHPLRQTNLEDFANLQPTVDRLSTLAVSTAVSIELAPSSTSLTTLPAPGNSKIKDSKIVYWKTCQFCHHSFEHLEQHLKAKKSKCSRDPEGQPWSAAQIKGLVNTSKKTMETNQKSKQYYSGIRLKMAIREAGTLHKLSIILFEQTGTFYDMTEVEDCNVLLQYSQKPSAAPSAAPLPMPQSEASADHELAVPPKHSDVPPIARPTQKTPVRASRSAAIVDSPDVQDLSAESEGSQYDPGSESGNSEPSTEDESDQQMEEMEEYKYVRPAKERNFKNNLRIEMSKKGLYQEYSLVKCRPEERAAMKEGVKLMENFSAWYGRFGNIEHRASKRFRNPLGCAQKIVFFVLEGTAYKYSNLQSAVRAEQFFDICFKVGMQPSTRSKYVQAYQWFLNYIASRGIDGPCKMEKDTLTAVLSALNHLDQKNSSLATINKRKRERDRNFDPNNFNTEDYRKMKKQVEIFMEPVLQRLKKNRLIADDRLLLTAYVCYFVSYLYGHRSGVAPNMKVEEFLQRREVQLEERKFYIVLVEEHKTASIKAAGVALDEREEKICSQYLQFVRPSLVNHGETSPSNFLLNERGKKIENGSQTARRFLEKVFPDGIRKGVKVPNQLNVRHFISTINDRDEETTTKEKEMMNDYLCHSAKTAKNHYHQEHFERVAKARVCIQGTTERATGISLDPNTEETDVLQTKAAPQIDDVIRKRMVNEAVNKVLEAHPVSSSPGLKTITLKMVRATNPDITDPGMIKSVKDVYAKQVKHVRAAEVLKTIAEKRGLGADITDSITPESLGKAIKKLGFSDTFPTLEQVKAIPAEPVVDDYLMKAVMTQTWVGLTKATSHSAGAGDGVFTTLPFWENQVVVEYHGRRMETSEAKVLIRSLKGEEDGANYFLVAGPTTIDARLPKCECHPEQICYGRSINHQAKEDKPNLRLRQINISGVKSPFLVATRDIKAGEELRFDYGVRPGDFGEGQDETFLLPERKRQKLKNRRDPIPSNIPSEEASEDAAPAVEKETVADDGRKQKRKRKKRKLCLAAAPEDAAAPSTSQPSAAEASTAAFESEDSDSSPLSQKSGSTSGSKERKEKRKQKRKLCLANQKRGKRRENRREKEERENYASQQHHQPANHLLQKLVQRPLQKLSQKRKLSGSSLRRERRRAFPMP
jgi:hypothetical protein